MVPPNFTDNSHCPPHRVRLQNTCYVSVRILSCCNVHSTSRPTRLIHSAAKLQDVFIEDFPRASHQPATFCAFHNPLLVLITAFVILIVIIYMNLSLLSTVNSLFLCNYSEPYSQNRCFAAFLLHGSE